MNHQPEFMEHPSEPSPEVDGQQQPVVPVYRPMLVGSVVTVMVMALLALMSPVAGWRLLPSLAAGLGGMSVPEALGLIIVAGFLGVVAYRGWSHGLDRASVIVAIGLILAAAISAVVYFLGLELPFMPGAAVPPSNANAGAWSPRPPWSLMLIAVAGLSLRLAAPGVTGRRMRGVGSYLAVFVAVCGLAVCLAYVLGEPRLGAADIPMPFATAASFVFLSASLLTSGGARLLPPAAGSTMRTRIGRIFAVVAVLMSLGLAVALYSILNTTTNPVVGVIAWSIFFIVMSHLAIVRFARIIGNDYDSALAERSRSEAALRRSEAWFRAVFNESLDAIGVFRDGKLVSANPAALALLGYDSLAEIQGGTFADLLASSEASRVNEYARLRAAGEAPPSVYEARARRRDGTELDVELHVSLYQMDGAMHHMAVVRDISERKRTETDLRITQLSVDQSGLGVLWFRPDGGIDYANQAAADMLAYSLPVLKTRTVFDVTSMMPRAGWAGYWNKLAEMKSLVREAPLIRSDGSLVPAEITLNSARFADRQYAFAFIRDISERREFQRRLRITQASVDASSVAIFWIRADGSHYFVNEAACRLVGCSRDELLTLRVTDLDPTMLPPAWAAHWHKVKTQGDQTGQWQLARRDGTEVPVESVSSYVSLEGGVFLFAFIQDISERLRAGEALRGMNQVLEATLSSLDEAVLVFERAGHTIISCNLAVMPILGYSTDELLGQRVDILQLDEAHGEEYHRKLRAARLIGGTARFEHRLRRKDGGIIATEQVVRRLPSQPGEPGRAVSVIRDVTERKRAELALQDSLAEKDMLLREIHHRVKNNLQIIASLLNLQMEGVTDPVAAQVIRESQSRIRSMSLIHAKLYQSKDLAHVDFGSFVRDLASMLFHAYDATARGITYRIDASDITLGIDTVIPCSLIVNELLANAVRHAFPPGRGGNIVIAMSREDGRYTLRVADDGIGIPEGFDYRDSHTLGLRLVNMLTEQVNGDLELNRCNGTEFVVRFAGR